MCDHESIFERIRDLEQEVERLQRKVFVVVEETVTQDIIVGVYDNRTAADLHASGDVDYHVETYTMRSQFSE